MQGGVRKRGKTWSYFFDMDKVDGKRKKKEKGGFNRKKEAETALRKALSGFEKCGSIITESNMSVSDYFDYWYKEYVMINLKFHTQRYYKSIIDKHIKPILGTYKLKSLSPAIFQEFLNKKYLEGFSKSSVSSFYGVLSGALKAAVYPYQLIKENPVQYIKMSRFDNIKNKDKLKIITMEQFETIIKRFPQGSNFYIPLQIAFNTGMRAAQVCRLTWDCVDLENKAVKVEKILVGKGKDIWEFGTPKTKSSYRIIDIGDTLVKILNHHETWQKENKLKYGKYYKKSNFVCTKENGENITTDSLKYLSRVINYELGISFHFHSLRHTHATMDTYSHVTKKMKKETVNILESIIATQK